MWYLMSEFSIKSVHIIACLGEVVNDLLLFYKKNHQYASKKTLQTDRLYENINDRSKNYAVF